VARYTITDLMDDDGTWTADSVADLSTGLRARCSAETKDIEARSATSDALADVCDAVKTGRYTGDARHDGIDLASIRSDRWEWMKRYRIWDADRKIFLYPENWLEPEPRDAPPPTG
jgi:hypothetical protein